MIARTWSGAVRTSDADEYAAYIRETGFAEYGRTAGNRGAWLLRRDDEGPTEFVAPWLWDRSMRSGPSPVSDEHLRGRRVDPSFTVGSSRSWLPDRAPHSRVPMRTDVALRSGPRPLGCNAQP
jgi:hypothetical protein